MAEALPLSEGEIRFLDSLIRHDIRFMVVGLSAAALQGAPVVTENVDLWFENLSAPGFIPALRAVKAAYVPPSISNPPMLAGPHTELFDVVLGMSGLGRFADEIKHAKNIRVGPIALKVLPLERIVSKSAANRPKDRMVIAALKNALATLRKPRSPKSQRSKDHNSRRQSE